MSINGLACWLVVGLYSTETPKNIKVLKHFVKYLPASFSADLKSDQLAMFLFVHYYSLSCHRYIILPGKV